MDIHCFTISFWFVISFTVLLKSARVGVKEKFISSIFVVGLIKPLYVNTCSHFFFCGYQIETRNNKLEMQSVNNKALIEELDKVIERLRVPSEVCFTFFVLASLLSNWFAYRSVVDCSMQHP